jgi:hypothetical protein
MHLVAHRSAVPRRTCFRPGRTVIDGWRRNNDGNRITIEQITPTEDPTEHSADVEAGNPKGQELSSTMWRAQILERSRPRSPCHGRGGLS